MIIKYGVYDGKELKVKMDAIRQEPRQQVQLYFDMLVYKGEDFLGGKKEKISSPFQAENQKVMCGAYLC